MDAKLQFTVLYRQFLFRLMDVELLSASARGDASQLFGQFASLLLFVSLNLSMSALGYAGIPRPPEEVAPSVWFIEYSLVSITMLVVAIFAVFSWDATFPDRRDVLILAPLPVRARTLFAAKIAAVASALSLTIGVLNSLSGLAWPIALAPAGAGIVGTIRFVGSLWISLFAAGAFIYCVILGSQGVLAQLPRRWFLRASSFLQVAAFALFLGVFCLQPWVTTAEFLGAAENRTTLACLPSYWFLGLLSELSGAYGEGHSVMAPLARRAVWGLAIALFVAAGAFLLSWLRTIRKIAEDPDIVPGSNGGTWLPRFGNSPQTALAQFIIRTLGRSRQHRMNLAFYLGAGFAMAAVMVKPGLQAKRLTGVDVLSQAMNAPMLVSSLLMLCVWIVGARMAFSQPVDMRANWLFRVTPVRAGAVSLSATRRALLALSVLPACAGTAGVFLWFWPWPAIAEHVLLLALLGGILVDLVLTGFRKIPFTCSYLPGKTKIHVTFWASLLLFPPVLSQCVEFEQGVTRHQSIYWGTVAVLAGGGFVIRRLANRRADRDGPEIRFEESASDELLGLGLNGQA